MVLLFGVGIPVLLFGVGVPVSIWDFHLPLPVYSQGFCTYATYYFILLVLLFCPGAQVLILVREYQLSLTVGDSAFYFLFSVLLFFEGALVLVVDIRTPKLIVGIRAPMLINDIITLVLL